MTDNEIINALKLCTSEHMGCEDGCPYATKKLTYSQCKLELSKNIIDLINRQKTEIFELKKQVEHFQSKNGELFKLNNNLVEDIVYKDAEIKKLQKDKYRLQKALNQSEDYRIIAEANAYKKFANKIKTNLFEVFGTASCVIIKSVVNNTLKKLTEKNDFKES